jgi:hypothetical protein
MPASAEFSQVSLHARGFLGSNEPDLFTCDSQTCSYAFCPGTVGAAQLHIDRESVVCPCVQVASFGNSAVANWTERWQRQMTTALGSALVVARSKTSRSKSRRALTLP